MTKFTQTLDRGRIALGPFIDISVVIGDCARQITTSAQKLAAVIDTTSQAAAEAEKATHSFAKSIKGLSDAAHSGSEISERLIAANGQASTALGDLIGIVNEHHKHLAQLIDGISADVAASQEAVQKVHQ